MTLSTVDIQDQILIRALEDVPFEGWTWAVARRAAEECGYEADMADAVFPKQIEGFLEHFSDWADRQMLAGLQGQTCADMRIRDKIELGVKTRFEVLVEHKEAVRSSVSYWAHPFRKITAGRIVWRTADKIWNWAGDDAKDYNHYTKRGLLSGVMVSTMLVWLNDKSGNHQNSYGFLSRRIDNVLQFGKTIGKMKSFGQKKAG